jgi:serine/threonine protein kinase
VCSCKLSDFGTARTVEDPAELRSYSSGIGTPIYMAPELMNASKYNCKVDVYSFAMCCWELMAEKQPFHEVKRVWDLPRIVVDGLRPTIDETCTFCCIVQCLLVLSDCISHTHTHAYR